MIKSMTAYSRTSASSPLGKFVLEIHSVNRKMLDMSLYLPKDLLRFDIELRKLLGQSLERGQVTVRLTMQSDGASSKLFSHYASQLKAMKEGWEKVARDLGYDAEKMVDLKFLVAQLSAMPPPESKEDEEAILGALKGAVETGMKELLKMKEKEGAVLAADLLKRLQIIEQNAAAVEGKKEIPLEHYRKKLKEKLQEIGEAAEEHEERILREVALMAEKMDITEELVRLRTHVEHFRNYLASKEKAVGRTLDFLTQEMHREINTLGSKSVDSEISAYVVKMKSELDKIREQVQNIE